MKRILAGMYRFNDGPANRNLIELAAKLKSFNFGGLVKT